MLLFNILQHLPEEKVSVGVTIKLLKEDEELVGRIVLLIERYGVGDSVTK